MATRREQLMEAFEEAEETPEGEEKVVAPPEDETPLETKPEGETEGKEGKEGEGKEGEPKPDEKEVKKTPDQLEADAARRPDPKAVPKDSGTTLTRAPNSWKPAEREGWDKVPPAQRAAILRREKDIEKLVSETSTMRKFSESMAQVVQPHVQNIQAAGVTPLAAIDNLLRTASALMQGSAGQKAEIIANLISQNGVDIKTLDEVLSKRPLPGSGQAPAQNQNAIPTWAQPLFGFMQSAQQARQARDQELTESADAEIESATVELPFFEDLKPVIADLLEAAAKRGRVMTLKQGYEHAAALDPEVSKILSQRKLAARQPSNMAGKRRAASTVSGAPSGNNASGIKAKPGSRKEALAQAWEDAESR